MAGWRDRLLPASFAGVAFHVLGDETEVGRRLTSTDYPFRESPDLDDFGALARDYSLEALVIGDDYDRQRDRLLAIAGATGAGDLVHPHYGKIRARLRSARASHRSDEGGVCRLALVFVPDTGQDSPAQTVDEVAKALAAADAAQGATKASFLAKYKVAGWPSQVLAAAKTRVTRYGELVSSISSPALADAQTLADLALQARGLVNASDALIASPLALVEKLQNLSALVRRVYARDALSEFNRLRESFFDPYPTGAIATPATAQTVANADAFNALVRQSSISDAAHAALVADYKTRDDASAARAALISALDVELALAGGEYPQLLDLRAAVSAGIPKPGLVLPDVLTYLVPRTVPALLLAYQLYGDVDLEADITARNQLSAPAFIRGGTALEVIGAS